MATIGDLVVKLRLSNDTFRKNMQDAGRQAQQLDYDILKLERSTLTAEDSTARLGRAMNSPIYRAQMWSNVQAKSNQTVMQARAANDQLAAGLANSVVQTNLATQASLKLDREIMEVRQQTQLLATMQADAAMQAKLLALSEAQAAQALTQAQSATAQLAAQAQSAALAETNLAMAAEQMKQRSLQAAAAKRAEAVALAHFDGRVLASAATMRKYHAELSRGTAIGKAMGGMSGRTQMAIQQLVFAVDDAATSFGTGGWSGAIRGAANNLTTMAALLGGPWGAAVAVAIAAGTQLYMAFNKTGSKAKGAAGGVRDVTAALREQNDVIRERVQFQQGLRDIKTDDEWKSAFKGKRDELAQLKPQEANANAAVETQRKRVEFARQAGKNLFGEHGIAGLGTEAEELKQLKSLEDEARKIADRRLRTEQEIVQLRQKASELSLLEQRNRDAQGTYLALVRQQARISEEANARQKKRDDFDFGKQMQARVAQWGFGQERELFDKLQPTASKKLSVAEEYRANIAQVRALRPENQQELERGYLQTALQQLKSMNSTGPAKGPSGLEQGSREAFERIRQRQLEAGKPKQTQEQLLKELAKLLKTSQTIEKTQNETLSKILLKQPTADDLR